MRWLFRFFLINSVMLVIFVYSDYSTWTSIYNGLKPIEWVCAQNSGKLYNVTLGAEYLTWGRVLWIDGLYETETGFWRPRAGTSQTFNSPLLIFVITVALNLIMVLKMEKKMLHTKTVK